MNIETPELKRLLEDMLGFRGEKDITVEVRRFMDNTSVSLAKAGERVPFIQPDQRYRTIGKSAPTQLDISPLLRQKAGKEGSLSRMLDRALAELHWRLAGKSEWL